MIIYERTKDEIRRIHKFICDNCKREVITEEDLQASLSMRLVSGHSFKEGQCQGPLKSLDLCPRCTEKHVPTGSCNFMAMGQSIGKDLI